MLPFVEQLHTLRQHLCWGNRLRPTLMAAVAVAEGTGRTNRAVDGGSGARQRALPIGSCAGCRWHWRAVRVTFVEVWERGNGAPLS
jgi:hypothetical protein